MGILPPKGCFMEFLWQIAEKSVHADELASKLNIRPSIAQILCNRGITDYDSAQKFLNPKLNGLAEPDHMRDLEKAAKRIYEAIKSSEPIVIYGDYDVDGVTASAIMWKTIKRAGGNVKVFLPHRLEDGYGLNKDAIENIAKDGTKLMVTVDCGIRGHEALACARENNLTVIVTDHHEPDDTPPDAYAVLHPDLTESEAEDDSHSNLCGAAVAFKLAWAVAREISGGKKVDPEFRELLVEMTSFVALATIADVVPLTGENRIMVKFGLEQIARTRLTGLKALLNATKLGDSKKIDSYHIGFVLAPRLNAAGRMGHAKDAFDLLVADDMEEAEEIAKFLEKQNRARQKLEERITREAIDLAEYEGQTVDEIPILVLAKEDWHVGVIGIVASKLVDRLNKPAVMIAIHGEKGQGSARSVPGYDINQGLDACSDFLIGYGGHAMAAGLRIKSGKIMGFMEALQEHAAKFLATGSYQPVIQIDAIADPDELDANFIWQLRQLGPFGQGNRRPTLASDMLELDGTPRIIGSTGKHLSFNVRWGGKVFRTIAFNFAAAYEKLLDHRTCRLAFEPILDTYRGNNLIQLKIKDIKFEE